MKAGKRERVPHSARASRLAGFGDMRGVQFGHRAEPEFVISAILAGENPVCASARCVGYPIVWLALCG
jgi:hypothetical protein